MSRTTVSYRVADWIVRLRYAVAVFWAVAMAAALALLPPLDEADAGALGALAPRNADAVAAELRSLELFEFPLLSRTLVVQRDPDGLSAAEQAAVVRRVVALNRGEYPELGDVLGALAVANTLGKPPFSLERSTTAITYLFTDPRLGPARSSATAHRFVERRIGDPAGQSVGVTGAAPARAEQVRRIQEALPLVELATLALVVFAVGLHFRALAAPLVTVAAVAVSYLVSIRLLGWIGERAGIAVPSEVEPVIVVLLFGVITDYSIFFLSRFRRRLAEEEAVRSAATAATADLLPIITAAGLTVAGASGALLVAQLGFFRAFGPGMAIAVLIGLVVAITLIPALIAIVGRWTFWPAVPRQAPAPEGSTGDAEGAPRRVPRLSAVRLASTYPWVTTFVCAAVLLVGATGVLRLEVGNTLIRGLPADAEPREAYRQAAQGFAAGILAPTVVLVEGDDMAARRAGLRRLQSLIERQPGVAQTLGPREQPLRREFGAVFSKNGDAARMLVVLNADPLGAAGIRILGRVRARMPDLLAHAGLTGVRVSLAGDTAVSEETVAKTRADLARIAPAALLVIFGVLAIFLRALVAPLYLVAASVLALLASLGLTVYLVEALLGAPELTFYVPFAASVLLVALGSDYNVFLAGRIWAEARERPLREAVVVAGARAARPIAAAGIVLALSFALLAIVPLRPFRELAFAMSAGLLIDAFLVRTLLVPALITLVGERSGWPGGQLRARAEIAGPPN